MEAKDKIIFALDVDTIEEATSLVEKLAPYVGCFKIGLEFVHAMLEQVISPMAEDEAVENLKAIRRLFELLGGQIFWDGKFDDIPNTVAGASRAVTKIGVKMFNFHASAGIDSMIDAVSNKGNALALAVTVLTTYEENDAYLDFGAPIEAKVLQFARQAKLVGVDGVVCSAQELKILGKRKEKELKGLIKVTPAIRPAWAVVGDQKRITTPTQAIMDGADYIVVGRPVREPPKEIGGPVEAAKLIAEEIDKALA
jgi:orotidine-5'-phosphate decarboxylase